MMGRTPTSRLAPTEGSGRVDASMTLLTEILDRPLDPGYAAMAQSRARAGLPVSGGWRPVARVTAALVGVGLLLGVAAASVRLASSTRSSVRADLIGQIGVSREAAEAKGVRLTALNAELATLGQAALAAQPEAQQGVLLDLGLATGSAAVRGPAFVVTLDDAPDAAGDTGADAASTRRTSDGVVRARDLQIITNSLWAAGAEAIAINDQRLTSSTAIRFAGEALIVNFRPLNRPYVITAIGDPSSLPSTFANASGGSYASTLSSSFGIRVSTSTRAEVTLPASSSVATRLAEPLLPETPREPSPSSSGGTS